MYRCLVESTKIKSTSFPFKTALSEANVKTNRIAQNISKRGVLQVTALVFFENLFQF